MRTILSVIGVITALAPAAALAQTWTNFQVGGLTRKALVYVPSGINEPPLLISLHGMGIGAGWNQGEMMKFEPIADREKFIVVYPEADQNLRWDLGGTHDIDFILAIIEEMAKRHDIDRNRVYASGFSMGGMFSYTLACKIPEKIAAIAPGDGYPLGGVSGCVKTRPVPIFHMHGTADDFVKYSGIHAFLNTKVVEYGCPASPSMIKPYPPTKADSKSFKEYWGPCTNSMGQKSEIILISVAGMIHDWATAGKANANEDPAFAGKPFDINGSEEAWAFLKTHSLLGSDAPGGTGGLGSDAGATGGMADGGPMGRDAGVAPGGPADGGTQGGGGGSDGGAPGSGMAGMGSAQPGGTGAGGPMGRGDGGTGGTDAAGVGGFAGTGGSTAGAGVGAQSRDDSSGCSVRPSSQTSRAWVAIVLALGFFLRRRTTRRKVSVEQRSA